jgi:hypothetical protein
MEDEEDARVDEPSGKRQKKPHQNVGTSILLCDGEGSSVVSAPFFEAGVFMRTKMNDTKLHLSQQHYNKIIASLMHQHSNEDAFCTYYIVESLKLIYCCTSRFPPRPTSLMFLCACFLPACQ